MALLVRRKFNAMTCCCPYNSPRAPQQPISHPIPHKQQPHSGNHQSAKETNRESEVEIFVVCGGGDYGYDGKNERPEGDGDKRDEDVGGFMRCEGFERSGGMHLDAGEGGLVGEGGW